MKNYNERMKIQEADYNELLSLRHEVMYPNDSVELAKVENDAEGIHLGVYEKEKLVSVVSIFLKDRKLQFRKLATKNEHRGKGYASELIKYVIDFYNQFEFNSLWANSRVDSFSFYERLGFTKTDKTFSKNGHDYVVIEYAEKKQEEH